MSSSSESDSESESPTRNLPQQQQQQRAAGVEDPLDATVRTITHRYASGDPHVQYQQVMAVLPTALAEVTCYLPPLQQPQFTLRTHSAAPLTTQSNASNRDHKDHDRKHLLVKLKPLVGPLTQYGLAYFLLHASVLAATFIKMVIPYIQPCNRQHAAAAPGTACVGLPLVSP